jgi:subtilisin family serine protease
VTKAGRLIVLTTLIAVAAPMTARAEPPPTPSPPEDDLSAALAESDSGTIRVNVTMADEVTLDTLDTVLQDTDSEVLSELDSVAAAAVEVDRAGLEALRSDPAVGSVTPDLRGEFLLDSSTRVIASDRLNRAGVLGNNWEGSGTGRFEVAIVDTGVDHQHNAFAGKIVSEACYSATSSCPNGKAAQVGPGSADNCSFSVVCIHGTHVAGIAAGSRYRHGHEGVARGARIVAIRVATRQVSDCSPLPSPCAGVRVSDVNRALQRVLDLRRAGRRIVAVNLSLGFGLFKSTARCASAGPATERLASKLQAAGVAVIAAAGNGGHDDAIAFPACLPSVYAVSATNDRDARAGFSDVAGMTDWFAPGVDVVAPIPGGPNREASLSGTSMSAPHVAGAFALLRECIGNRRPADAAKDLRATGENVRVGGIIRPRINVLEAATRNVPNNRFANARRVPATGVVNIASWNVCADRQRGEPGHGIENSVWFAWTPAATSTATITTNPSAGHRTTFDTQLYVFTGRRLGTLHLVGSDDNSGRGNHSKLVIPVTGGTTYRIRVDGVRAQNGLFNLHTHTS